MPNIPFGGKIVVLGGDFRQTVITVSQKIQQEIIEYSLLCSPFWPFFTRLQLTENIRAREDPEFLKFLLALGNGELQVEKINQHSNRIVLYQWRCLWYLRRFIETHLSLNSKPMCSTRDVCRESYTYT